MLDIGNVIHAHVLHYLVPNGSNILCTVEAGFACPAHHENGGHTGHQFHQQAHLDQAATRVWTEMASSPGAPLTHHGIPRVTKSLPSTPYQCLQPFTLLHTDL